MRARAGACGGSPGAGGWPAGGPGEPLEQEGWTRRFVAAPPRLQEAVELYRSMGFEVRLEPPDPEEFGRECSGCVAALRLFRIIYTRGRAT